MLNNPEELASFDPENDTIILLHMPKTGGTSLEFCAHGQYNPSEVLYLANETVPQEVIDAEPPSFWDRIKIVYVSVYNAYNINEKVKGRPFYITVIREPVSRSISDYYYSIEATAHFWNMINLKNTDILTFLMEESLHLTNTQSRLLAGIRGHRKVTWRQVETSLNAQPSWLIPIKRFNESLHHLEQYFGWTNLNRQQRNARRTQPSLSLHPKEVLKKLEEITSVDRFVFDQADQNYDTVFPPKTIDGILETNSKAIRHPLSFPEPGEIFVYGNRNEEQMIRNYMTAKHPQLPIADWIDSGERSPKYHKSLDLFRLPLNRIISAATIKNLILTSPDPEERREWMWWHNADELTYSSSDPVGIS